MTQSAPACARRPAAHVLDWCTDGARLWRRAPLRLFALALAPTLAEALIQMIPDVGVILSKMVVPMLTAGVVLGMDRLARQRRLPMASLWAGFAPRRVLDVLLLSLFFVLVFVVQVAVAMSVYGPRVLDAVVLAHLSAYPALTTPVFICVLILPGLVPLTALTLAFPVLMLHGCPPWQSVCASVRGVLRNWQPFTLFLLLSAGLMAVTLTVPFAIVLLLILVPWLTAAGYAAYRDVIADPLMWRTASTATATS